MPKVVPLRPRPMTDIQARSLARPISSLPQLDAQAAERLRAQTTQPQPEPQLPTPTPTPTPLRINPRRHLATTDGISPPQQAAPNTVPKTAATPPATPSPTAVAPRHLPPIDMDLPGDESPLRRLDSLLRHGKLATARRWAFRGVAAVLALAIVGGGLLLSQGYLNLRKSFKGGASAAALKANVNPNLLKGEGDGRINVLLLGRGGGNHDGPDLTDTMMLASIDPVNHTSTLISIPRDLWIDMPNEGAMKINAAWETGEFKYLGKVAPGSTNRNAIQAGFDQVDQTVEGVLGVTIDYNVLVNFQAFQQAVDTVNGITVNVPTDLIDPTMAWENKHDPVLAKAGIDNFAGKQALNYVRSRETTSDFARAQRQRAVLLALKSKVGSLGTLSNPLKLSGLVNAFGNNVQTDLSLNNANRLYGIVKRISDSKTNSIGLSDPPNNYLSSGTLAGQAIALPTAGLFNYRDIQTFVRAQLKDPYIVKENAKILVLNGTLLPGLATTKANELKAYGYNVVGIGNTPNSGWTQTTLINLSSGKKNKYTTHYLEERLGVTATKTLPDKTIQTNGADFVIILGSNEAIPPQT